METGIHTRTALVTTIAFIVYLLVITVGGATQCMCGDNTVHDTRHTCCSECMSAQVHMPNEENSTYQNILADSACEACPFIDMFDKTRARIETTESPRETSSGRHAVLHYTTSPFHARLAAQMPPRHTHLVRCA